MLGLLWQRLATVWIETTCLSQKVNLLCQQFGQDVRLLILHRLLKVYKISVGGIVVKKNWSSFCVKVATYTSKLRTSPQPF